MSDSTTTTQLPDRCTKIHWRIVSKFLCILSLDHLRKSRKGRGKVDVVSNFATRVEQLRVDVVGIFWGEKLIYMYVYRERERGRDLFIYCHLTKIYEMNTFYQPILVIFSQISRFEKTCYQNSSKNQVSCHLFPRGKKRLIASPTNFSRLYCSCLRKAAMQLGLCFIIVGKQVLRTGSGWSMDFPKNYLS